MADKALPDVGAPDPAETGFIGEFLSQTNAHDSYDLLDGDVVDFQLTSPGFKIDPVAMRETKKDDPTESQDCSYSTFSATVVLRREPAETSPLSRADKIHVEGLIDNQYRPLSFSLSSRDPLSHFITYDEEKQHISLNVSDVTVLDDMSDSQRSPAPGIFFNHDVYYNGKLIKSSFLHDLWHKYQYAEVSEGVLFDDNAVPSELATLLNEQIGRVAEGEPVDWHPGSRNCVRDLVHPSLYPLVRGESPVTEEGKKLLEKMENKARERPDDAIDRWGRKFELSKYQWLPTIFRTSSDGTTSIDGYINNLDAEKYSHLYSSLSRMFEIFLPRFEKVYAYVKAINILPDENEGEEGLMDIEREYNPNPEGAQLRNMELRVITKIIDYELREDTDFVDGVFHVEGMSSDHIIMTGIYVVDRDDCFLGGNIEFRRTFLDYEGGHIFENISQGRPRRAEQIVEDMIRPLGQLETPKGRMIVFPNSHIHKLSRMTRQLVASSGNRSSPSRRRIIVFWVVDPDEDVVSTRDVPRQQGTTMTEKQAKEHRLLLMEERKKHKGRLNGVRKISLCEH